jgi:hypothetical protein
MSQSKGTCLQNVYQSKGICLQMEGEAVALEPRQVLKTWCR